jgi:nucleoside 2-deoxyribosyltransferase
MKIYIGHTKSLDYKNELYEPLRFSILNKEHEIILPHETHQNATDFVTRDIIKSCDLMIAEVSFSATGLGIEIGWADAFKCPIICIYRQGQKTSGSLKVVTDKFIEYTDRNDMIEKLILVINKFRV